MSLFAAIAFLFLALVLLALSIHARPKRFRGFARGRAGRARPGALVFAGLAVCCTLASAAFASDYLKAGADDTVNGLEGLVDYSRPSCLDASGKWDRIKCSAVNLLGAKFDDDAVANCGGLSTTSTQFTLPTAGDWYCVSAIGTAAYLLCGTNPTATTTVTSGFSFFVPEGAQRCRILTGAKCAYVATSGTPGAPSGSICFEHMNSAL